MSKLEKIYDALVDGAEDGLAGTSLYDYVVKECPKATSKKIVKASLLALSDPDLKEEKILKVIYDLAIKHRLDPVSPDDAEEEPAEKAPKLKADRRSKKPKHDAAGDAPQP
jgi:hypothetical protein